MEWQWLQNMDDAFNHRQTRTMLVSVPGGVC
jgi:hypothetical protein